MALFKRDFNKPGPGVPKNAPRKRGFGRFFELITRDFSNLVKLNLIYALSLLPAFVMLILTWVGLIYSNTVMFFACGLLALVASIPVGPSTTAMYYIVTKMLRDDPGFIWHDYKKQFKANFRSMLFPGIIYAVIFGSQVFAFMYYTQLEGGIGFAMIAIYMFSVLLLAMAAPYFFTQAAYVDLKPLGLLKNSLLMALGYAPRSFMGALLGSGLLLAQVLFLPLTLIILAFIGFTIPCLLNLMWIWPNVDKTFKIEETLRARHRKAMGDVDDEEEQTAEIDSIQSTEDAQEVEGAAEEEKSSEAGETTH